MINVSVLGGCLEMHGLQCFRISLHLFFLQGTYAGQFVMEVRPLTSVYIDTAHT